jgi:glycosyltransferase involved in cell wall biosynthesis
MIDLLLDAMRIMAADKRGVSPDIHIYGLVHPQDLDRIARLDLQGHFRYFGFVPYSRSLIAMKQAKALLLLLPHAGDSTSCVPSKLYHYLGSGRPIVVIAPPGDATRIIEETGAGLAITDTDPHAVADKLSEFVAAVRNGTLPVGRDEAEIQRYSLDATVAQLDRILLEEMSV